MNKIILSMEVPTQLLPIIDPFIDSHFIIGTEALKDPSYLAFYKEYNRKPGHKLTFLDNGMYEEGKPLSPKELLGLTLEVKPDVVFASDVVGDASKTFDLTREFLELCKEVKYQGKVGVIPQGKDTQEILDCHETMIRLLNFDGPIGLSFLNDRQDLFKKLKPFRYRWYHALGLYSLDEIATWPWFIESMDTVKPLKAAYHYLGLETPVRGLGKWNSSMLFDSINQYSLLYRNLALLHTELSRNLEALLEN